MREKKNITEKRKKTNIEYINKIYYILNKKIKEFQTPYIDLLKEEKKKKNDHFRILIGTILSARTRDETTAKVCNKLFKKINNFQQLRKIRIEDLEKLIYPVGFYKTKTRNIKKLSFIIKEKDDKIPETIEELVKLPGVGRKTANLVVSVAFNKQGICVDTHVHRITNRLKIVNTKTPLETEMKLRKILPKKLWIMTNRIFVPFGQKICKPIKPNCKNCPLNNICPEKTERKKL